MDGHPREPSNCGERVGRRQSLQSTVTLIVMAAVVGAAHYATRMSTGIPSALSRLNVPQAA